MGTQFCGVVGAGLGVWLGDRAGGSSRFWGSSPTPGGVHWVVVVYVDARKVRLGWGSCWCLGARLPSPLATTCHAVVNDLRLDIPPAPSLLLTVANLVHLHRWSITLSEGWRKKRLRQAADER